MRRELLALALFIGSVCQIYLLRDVREALYLAGLTDQRYNDAMYEALQVCKTMMVLGVCIGIYQRVKAKRATLERESIRKSQGVSLMVCDEED